MQAINIKYSGWNDQSKKQNQMGKMRNQRNANARKSKGIESTKAEGRGGTIRG